jgi:hypothetical protein
LEKQADGSSPLATLMLKVDAELLFQTTTTSTFCNVWSSPEGDPVPENCPKQPESWHVVQSFIADNALFYAKFSLAWVKMTELGLEAVLQTVG